jgi:hypothetical protein
MALLERREDLSLEDDVAPSFTIKRPRRTPLRIVGDVIAVFNRRAEDHVQEDFPPPPRTFQPRPEPPLETLARPMPKFSARRTAAGNASR